MPATFTKIASVSISSTTATVTFSSIPQTFTDLRFEIGYSEASPNGDGRIRFNGDTTSTTDFAGVFRNASTPVEFGGSAFTPSTGGVTIYQNCNTSTGASRDNCAHNSFDVIDYRNTNKYTTITSRTYTPTNSGWTNLTGAAIWRNTAAITEAAVTANGSWGAGTIITLYGILRA
jgi:hypothetical protein